MPKNLINIKDTTGEPLTLSNVKTIYIPGPSYVDTANPENADVLPYDADQINQILCTTIDDLKNCTEFTDQKDKNPMYPRYIKNDSLSYQLAYYLINTYGFYVVYEGIGSNTTVPEASWNALKYCDYNIDFITTGQFGGVDKNAATCAEYRKDCTYLADHTNLLKVKQSYELLKSKPSDWETNWTAYKKLTNPDTYIQVGTLDVSPKWEPNKYYYALVNIADENLEAADFIGYVLTTEEPTNWNTEYMGYFTKQPPTFDVVPTKTIPTFENNKYYRYIGSSQTDPPSTADSDYEQLRSAPTNWDTNYTDYYTQGDPISEGNHKYIAVEPVSEAPTFNIPNKIYYQYISETAKLRYVDKVRNEFTNSGVQSDYAAGFTPWFKSSIKFNNKKISDPIPASFGYLFAYANSIKTNPVWLAVAGPERGIIPELISLEYNYSKQDVEILQARASDRAVDLDQPDDNIGIAINPIANIRPFGTIIYGNRTLHYNNANGAVGELKASSFLNIRNLVSLIARTAYTAANRYKFDQNNSLLWNKFSSVLIPVLDSAVSGGGIVGYKLDQVKTKKKARLQAKLTIIPIEAVEDLELDIILTDSLEVEVG